MSKNACYLLLPILFSLTISDVSLAALGRKSLKGLGGVSVVIDDLDSDAQEAGLTKSQLQTDVELRMRKSSVQVANNSHGYLYVVVSMLKIRTSESKTRIGMGYTCFVQLSFIQQVVLLRDSSIAVAASTWRSGGYQGIVPAMDDATRAVREALGNLVDEFINDYLAENPK